ncbi:MULTISPECIES: EamA family transporter [Acidiphilium]|uniref:Putative amino acid efflux protein n=1 Tax=Acidiphilium multivorum (strain DSM 11245 / JCM 8867 / NBRC 100883 / AIU 301) TaxID=926570 RepID=F0J469_ACIMA|nr:MULTISPECIES: EamA family transporter [Acidiphilium]MBU6357151.1 EamA family transporter [Rhodospirillales bacterium]KDM67194.1 putative amino-acid metabolite efflux pump [Acidiphilium sp. JA12-A1]MBS3023011.1 EamA family transporter [Acidiphilium multivorum]MDE2327449.1 EamA family transporter [Rhodospirillales bacterium]UNC14166.1 EamA family transporter [Acidiphilium multivorum]
MSESQVLSPRHALLALAVVAVWGTNFVVIRLALDQFPPFLLAGLRFTLAAVPGVFFLPRPRVKWSNLAAYGLLIGAGQFGLLFFAMDGRISPGLASLVIQTQVFFTIFLSMARIGERLRVFQIVACLLAVAGIGVIMRHVSGGTTLFGLLLVLLAASSWAIGNIVARESGARNALAYVVWSSLFAAPPLLLVALLREGPAAILHSVTYATPAGWLAVVWQSVGNSWFGYGSWAFLLARYPSATVSPMALLVPVFGMAASVFWLGEPMPAWKLGAAGLVFAGLAISVFYPRWRAAQRLRTA